MMERAARFIQKEPVIWGPLSLLLSCALGAKLSIPFELLFLAVGGFFLSSRYQMRGCFYSIALLALTALARHLFLTGDHLWQLGIEGSLGIAFFITALSFEQGSSLVQALESQIETGKNTLQNLEEELLKMRESLQSGTIGYQEKLGALQKELEETQAEHSSILILNEVLRKTSARSLQEAKECEQLKREIKECEEELQRVKNSDALAIQNRELLKELNQARYDQEQIGLINETLVRVHAGEKLKVKEAEESADSYKQLLQSAHKEVRRIKEPLEEQIRAAKEQGKRLEFEFEKTNLEANRLREELLSLNAICSERNVYKAQLESAMQELSLKKVAPVDRAPLGIDPEIKKEAVRLSQIEPLYKQLKQQFEEKNQLLHQVRSNLFKTDTELQKVKIEKETLELNPLPKEIEKELDVLAGQIKELEEENRELQDVVTVLMSSEERKKKVKTASPSSDQALLF